MEIHAFSNSLFDRCRAGSVMWNQRSGEKSGTDSAACSIHNRVCALVRTSSCVFRLGLYTFDTTVNGPSGMISCLVSPFSIRACQYSFPPTIILVSTDSALDLKRHDTSAEEAKSAMAITTIGIHASIDTPSLL